MNIEADLISDFVAIFGRHGIRYRNKSFQETLIDYLTYHRKFIQIKKREVNISKEISDRINTHSQKVTFQSIVDDAQNGKNLNCYQSDTLKQVRFHDYLLYTWNIHHFHLSAKTDANNKYFKKRTNNLVFAYVNQNSIFFLDFDTHRDGVFADERWLSIIQKNWPDLIEKYKDDKITDLYPNVTPSERQVLWNKGYTLGMTKVNDVVYHDPGLGIMSSGHSTSVIMQADDIRRWIYGTEQWFIENKGLIYYRISLKYSIPVEAIKIKARLANSIELYDRTSGEVICKYP